MKTTTGKQQATKSRFRWHQLYFVLAAFDLLTIVGSLFLTHSLLGIYTQSIVMHGALAKQAAGASELTPLIAAVNSPGNDVFDNGRIQAERLNLRDNIDEFRKSAKDLCASFIQADNQSAVDQLGSIQGCVENIEREANAIFDDLAQGRRESAGVHMAKMDQHFARALEDVTQLGRSLRSIESTQLNSQVERAQNLGQMESWLAGVVIFIVLLVSVYGHGLSRSMRRTEEREQQYQLRQQSQTRSVALLKAIAVAANATNSQDEVLQRVLSAFCRYTGWQLGHVYIPTGGPKVKLISSGIWYTASEGDCQAFRESTESTQFLPGQALPGIVYQTKKARWVVDLRAAVDINRPRMPEVDGIAAAFAFPVILDDEVVAVLEFFSASEIEPDEELVELSRSLGETLSRVFERSRFIESLNQARDAAQEANRVKSEFLANMSHEIRTPMTAIIGNTEILLEEEEQLSDFGRESLLTIERSGNHLLQLINDILDLSKVESGKMEIEKLSCSTGELLNHIESVYEVKAKEKNIGLHVRIDSAIPAYIYSDPTRLLQVLTNLVGNAIKFTEQGQVEVIAGYDHDQQQFRIEVQDTGIGIQEEALETLFDAFTQADTSTTRKFGGTGLGLCISRKLARRLGGEIQVESQVGRGSCFSLLIPAHSDGSVELITCHRTHRLADSGSSQAPTKRTLAGWNILLAEDGPENQKLISFVLKKAGAAVVVAENGRVAVNRVIAAQVRGCPFDAILMDMQMPILDGYAAVEELRRKRIETPILALTAHAMAGDRRKCIQAGCDDYLTKPINRQELIQKISQSRSCNANNKQAEATIS